MNTASAPLLARISGLNATLAGNIVEYRNVNGPYRSRDALKKVPRLGPKTFEQAAGFLRIPNGDDPLDASAVHPEAYPVVARILADVKKNVRELMGNSGFLSALDPKRYTDERFGLPTVKDILRELDKPGRDPRPEFRAARFADGIEDLKDLVPGMLLEGVVTNVTNFGAFIDIGVHQDGLVHISMLSERFVKDPREVVKAGDIVKVKVLEVDIPRKRIALTMRLSDDTPRPAPGARDAQRDSRGPQRDARRAPAPRQDQRRQPEASGALASAFARALKK